MRTKTDEMKSQLTEVKSVISELEVIAERLDSASASHIHTVTDYLSDLMPFEAPTVQISKIGRCCESLESLASKQALPDKDSLVLRQQIFALLQVSPKLMRQIIQSIPSNRQIACCVTKSLN